MPGRESGRWCKLKSPKLGEFTLRPGDHVGIGRHASNQIVVDHPAVSRFHARIVWDERLANPELFDSGSQNGTRVDGKRVPFCEGKKAGRCLRAECPACRAQLRHGSRVEIGPHRLLVELAGFADTLVLDDTPALLRDSDELVALFTEPLSEIRGELEGEHAARRLLERLEGERRTGTLVVEPSSGGEARVTYCRGRVMWVESPEGTSLRALERLLRVKKGRYRFSRELKPEENPMNLWFSDYIASRGMG